MSETTSANSSAVLGALEGVQPPPRLQGQNSEENFRAIIEWAYKLFNAVGILVLNIDARLLIVENDLAALQASLASLEDLAATAGGVDDSVVDVGATHNQTVLNNNFRDVVAKINALKAALDLPSFSEE